MGDEEAKSHGVENGELLLDNRVSSRRVASSFEERDDVSAEHVADQMEAPPTEEKPPTSLLPGKMHFLGLVRNVAFVVAYYIVGIWLYGLTEHWTSTKTTYFLSITVSTVGYGDAFPESYAGRWITSFYIPVGMILIFSIFDVYCHMIKNLIIDLCVRWLALIGSHRVDVMKECPIELYSPAQVNRKVNYTKRYLVVMSPVVFLFVLFILVMKLYFQYSWGSSVYFAVVTCTTVGYGDFNFGSEQDYVKLAASIYIILFVITFANCFHDVVLIKQRHGIRSGNLAVPLPQDLEELLLKKFDSCYTATELAKEPVFTEADYVISTLVRGGMVDEELLFAIRRSYYWSSADGQDICPTDVLHFHKSRIRRLHQRAKRRQKRQSFKKKAEYSESERALLRMSTDEWLKKHWAPKAKAARKRRSDTLLKEHVEEAPRDKRAEFSRCSLASARANAYNDSRHAEMTEFKRPAPLEEKKADDQHL